MKKVLKIGSLVLSGLLVCVVLLAALTQTQMFRNRLRAAALSSLDSLLVGAEIHLGNLTGNLVSGFSLDHISVKVHNDFLLSAERVDLRYDLLEIPGKTISISEVKIIRPEVKLLRGRDGIWNFQRMVRPTLGDTTPSGGFNWTVRVHRLEIQEGIVVLVDSASLTSAEHPIPDPSAVEYHRFSLQQFNLITSASIRSDERRAVISSLSFLCEEPQLRLQELSGEFLVTPSQVSVTNLRLRTDKSEVELTAAMRQVDLFGGLDLERLQHTPVRTLLRAHNVDFAELKQFIPELKFLNGTAALDVEANGEFGNLHVQQLDLTVGETKLHFTGSVANLHEPGNLTLKVKSSGSKIFSPDVLHLLPTFGLPDHKALGVTTLDMDFDGKPWDFRTKFVFTTDAGDLQGDVSLLIGGPRTLVYSGEVFSHNLDLAKILAEERLTSQLNGVIRISGAGVSAGDVEGTCSVKIDSSQFMRQVLRSSEMSLEARGRNFTGAMNVSLGSMHAALSGSLDETESNVPSFSVHGSVSSVNLEDILNNAAFNSDLSMTIQAMGTGLTWDRLNAEFLVDVSQSRFGKYAIESDSIQLYLNQRDSVHKTLKCVSRIADFSLTGAFNIESLTNLLVYQTQTLGAEIAARLHVLDSTLSKAVDRSDLLILRSKLAMGNSAVDARYSLLIKNLEPISIVTGNRSFNASGVFTGAIKGDHNRLRVEGHLELEDFLYGNVDAGVLVQNGSASFVIDDLKPVDPLAECEIHLAVDAGTMHLNRIQIDSAKLDVTYHHDNVRFAAQATIDREVQVAVQGLSKVLTDQLLLTLSDFQLAYNDYAWKADPGASIGFNGGGIRVRDIVLRRDAQTVTLAGSVGTDGALDASVTGEHLDLAALKFLMAQEELRPMELPFKGVASLSVAAKGSLSQPEYTASVRAEDVYFRMVPFGSVRSDFSYSHGVLATRIEVDGHSKKTAGEPDLTVIGSLPINLSLMNVSERFPEAPMDFAIRSEGIQMSILDPLLPTFNQLTGELRCNVKVVGSPRRPNYEGSLRIDNCSFLFVPNNIVYTLEGSFKPEGDRIKIVDAAIRNVSADEQFKREGKARLSGDFALREFIPTDFNITAHGQLLVVKESTIRSELSVYGNLFVEIGDGGLRLTGSIDQSLLKGNLTVRNSSLVFPPTQAVTARQYSSTVPLVVVDDTATVSEPQPNSALSRYFGSAGDSSALRYTQLRTEALPGRSFIDGMRYDLDITTEGANTELRMVFYTAPPEELVATINGRFSITEDGKKWYGDLRVGTAYYNFYNKRFDADGSLRYTGDFLNPELDIKATYQGTRVREDSSSADRSREGPERIIVTVKITGRRLEPKIDMTMTIDGEEYASYKGVKSGDVQTDAIAFIISGTFPLTRPERNDLAANIGKTVGASLVTGATSLLSGTLSEFLRRQTGFITSLEFGYGAKGDFGETPDIRLSGVAAGGLWRYGGKINDPLSNASVSIRYSLGDVFDAASLRNFMLELERKVEASSVTQGKDQAIRSARLFYRISF